MWPFHKHSWAPWQDFDIHREHWTMNSFGVEYPGSRYTKHHHGKKRWCTACGKQEYIEHYV